jgi:hypothetical protein
LGTITLVQAQWGGDFLPFVNPNLSNFYPSMSTICPLYLRLES